MFLTIRLKKQFWLGTLAMLCIGAFAFCTINARNRRNEDIVRMASAQNATGAKCDSDEKVVYLTFDDGPSDTTAAVLDILKENGVNATFFVMADGNNTKNLPILERTKAEGNVVALHTSSHEYSQIYKTAEAYWQDLDLLRSIVEPFVGEVPNLLRFPGGSTNSVAKRSVMEKLIVDCGEKGYRYFDWNVCANDSVGKKRTAEYITNTVTKEAAKHKKAIVLFHDANRNDTSAEALPAIIKWFKDNGYRFDTVDNLPV